MKDKLIVYCDGGSRGNPGESAYGFVIYSSSGDSLFKEGKKLGVQTNNYAEYSAVIAALSWILKNTEMKAQSVHFYLDSKLAVEQLSGRWRIKSENVRPLFLSVKNLEQKLAIPIFYTHVPREKNKEADLLVNNALDAVFS